MSLVQYFSDYAGWQFSDTQHERPGWRVPTDENLARTRRRIAVCGETIRPWMARGLVAMLAALFIVASLRAAVTEGGASVVIIIMIMCFMSLFGVSVATAMTSNSWWFHFDYWRELWLHQNPDLTFGPATFTRPIRVVGKSFGWIFIVVAASVIEAEVTEILDSTGSPRLDEYAIDLAGQLIPTIAGLYLAWLLASLPFAMRRVHQSDRGFVERHGVEFASLGPLLVRAFVLVAAFALLLTAIASFWTTGLSRWY